MTVTVTDAGPSEKNIEFQISDEGINEAKKIAARRLSKEIKIKGFRPGHAPVALVENAVGKDRLRSEAIEEVISDRLKEIFEEHDIHPAVNPELSSVEDIEGGVKVSVKATMWPDIEPPEYQNLRIEVGAAEVSDEEINEQLDRIRDQFAQLESVDRSAVIGDFVGIDISANKDGNPVPEATAEQLLYEVGSDGFLPGLDEVLVGASAGDVVEHSAPLPEGFGELAGQQVDFRVLVTSVSRKVLPEVSDEWITEISEFDTVDDFKADLSEAIDVAKKKVLLRRFREGAVARLTEGVTVPIPQAIVDLEAQDVVNQFAHRLGREGITLENYMEVTGLDQNRLMEDARNQAENNLRTRLALEAIASTENIQVTGEDLTRFIESASANSEKPEQTRRLLQSRAAVIVGDILRSRAMDVVLSTATPVDDKGNPVDLSEVDGGGSVETEPESDEPENNVREVVDGEGSESDNLEAVVEATTETLAEDASEDSTEASGEEE